MLCIHCPQGGTLEVCMGAAMLFGCLKHLGILSDFDLYLALHFYKEILHLEYNHQKNTRSGVVLRLCPTLKLPTLDLSITLNVASLRTSLKPDAGVPCVRYASLMRRRVCVKLSLTSWRSVDRPVPGDVFRLRLRQTWLCLRKLLKMLLLHVCILSHTHVMCEATHHVSGSSH